MPEEVKPTETEPVAVGDKKESEPTKPVVNVTAVDVEELEKRIAERVRQEEKAKLYDTLEKVKREKEEADAKLKEYETSKLTTEEQIQAKLREGDEKITTLTQQLDQAKTIFETELSKIAGEAQNEVKKIRLDAEKDKIKLKYGGEIIEELVEGNTIEELQDSAEKAHNIYKAIRDRETAKLKEELEKQQVGSGINPTSTLTDNVVGDVDLNKVNDKAEWDKIRKSVLEKALRLG
jgi:hypothetical protein